ncbi:MAG: NADH-quinone oxidoreductase subunit I [Verrucomicrobia bacterium]|nr:NADH-quinone oxidoreductase subunit I [Verrucomicrobiota bacterium]
MSLKTAIRETYDGFKSLITGMRITAREAAKPTITVQYPHETLPMPDRFRGHVKLILDPATGQAKCNACGLCVRACPSNSLEVDGAKREGEKRKSVSKYELDFTTCSLCGCCVEACPSDAIEYSKEYNVVSRDRDDFAKMDIYKRLQAESEEWKKTHPTPPAPPAEAAPAATPTPATPVAATSSPAAAPVVAPAATPAKPATSAPVPAPAAASPAAPEQKPT